MSKIIKNGKHPIGNRKTCLECGCLFEFYNTDVITEYVNEDDQAFFGVFGFQEYVKCPQCGTAYIIRSKIKTIREEK